MTSAGDGSRRVRSGGELVTDALVAAGVEVVFGLAGGHLEGLFKACDDMGIRIVDGRHEAAVVHAADAYARTTGKLGVAIVTAGPGFTNAITGIANAKLDRSPVLVICGAPPVRELETNELQGGIDQVAAGKALAKWALAINSTERLRDMTSLAIRKARAMPSGPVVLELPIDVLHMSVADDRAAPAAGANVVTHPAPSPADAETLAEMVRAARRPVLVAGLDAANAQTATALRKLTERLALPVFTQTQSSGILPPGHRSDGGAAGGLGAFPLVGVERPDLVILLGAEMGLLLGGRSGAVVPDDARLAQIHSDSSEPGRIRDVDLAITADCALAVEALDRALGSNVPDLAGWCEKATSVAAMMAAAFANTQPESPGGIHPWHAAQVVARVGGSEVCYALDGGEAASWAGDAISVETPGRKLGHGYLGALGIGPGFAIGLQVAHPDRRVLLVTGDGGFGFHLQELDTMMRHNLPIVTVVFNNKVWGMSIHGQQMMYGANFNLITRLGETSYAGVAKGFGCHGEQVTKFADIEPALRRALEAKRPALVEIMIDAEVVHPVTVAMLGQVTPDSNEVMIPYYENVEG